MTSNINAVVPADGVPASKAQLRANLAAAKSEIEALQTQVGNISPYVFNGMRNRVLNGAFRFDQRNFGGSVAVAAGAGLIFGADRWYGAAIAGGGAFTMQRLFNGTVPGFPGYTRITTTTPKGILVAADSHAFHTAIEGYHWSDMTWGTANATNVTLSFWVRGSIAGSYAVALTNAAGANTYVASYTISAPNVWEYKTITIPGYTGGIWSTGITTAVGIRFDLGTGSTYSGAINTWFASNKATFSGAVALITTNGATLDLTAVQLEPGSIATPYDYRLMTAEWVMLNRYLVISQFNNAAYNVVGSGFTLHVMASPILRSNPTVTLGSESVSGLSARTITPSTTGFLLTATSSVTGTWNWAAAYSADAEITI